MHPVLQSADSFRDLLELENHDAPYRFEQIFEDGGWRTRRHSKKKFTLLRRIDEELREVLAEDEEVLFLTLGSDTSGIEAYFLGWWLYLLFRRAIVLTDRRILFLQIGLRKRPKELRSQIRYPAIVEATSTLLRRVKFELQDGTTEVLGNAPRRDAGRIREIVEERGTAPAGSDARTGGVEDLCPHCYAVVAERPDRCPDCGGSFRSARKAGALSLAFPGLGDLYLGHRGFAALEIFTAAVIWFTFWAAMSAAAGGSPSGVLVGAAFIVAVVHGVDAAGTWYIGRKALYPGEASAESGDARQSLAAAEAA